MTNDQVSMTKNWILFGHWDLIIGHSSGDVFQEANHLEGGFGGFGAFVADVAAGAVDGLFHCFTGEYAKQHGNVRIETDLRDRDADGTVDVLIVSRFAADYGA